jgi:hypothetical protein
LGIYHFQEHAGYLGDMMEFMAVLNVIREENGLEKVDLCYVDDRSNPNRPISRERLESSPQFKAMMVSLRGLLPSLGAVFEFDSDSAFEMFFRTHYRKYVCWPQYSLLHSWPSKVNYARHSERGFAYPNTYAPIDVFFQVHGRLPFLSCPPRALEWARNFVTQHVSPAVPIAAQIRFNPESPYRNTDLAAWTEFFRRMQAHSAIKFVIVCRHEEIIPELRALPNTVYAKDHGSGILEDLALVQVSHFSMFPDSGFCTFPWFCGLPSLYFGKRKLDFAQRRMRDVDGNGLRFLSSLQRRIWGEYTVETLEKEFWALWKDLEAARWRNPHLERCG